GWLGRASTVSPRDLGAAILTGARSARAQALTRRATQRFSPPTTQLATEGCHHGGRFQHHRHGPRP
ncbi:MAG: hypothetical protein ACK40D_05625, partial [Cyanobacteriota bacterium]